MSVFFLYFFFLASFLAVLAVIRKGPRIGLYAAILVYLAIGSLATVLLIGEIQNRSIDANIGLGISLLLMEWMSIAGFILAIIIASASYMMKRKQAS